MSIKWSWGVIFCLGVFVMMGGIADALDISETNISNGVTNNSGEQWNYKNDVTAVDGVDIDGSGTTVFEKKVDIGPAGHSPIGPEHIYGLFITNGTNTFQGNVTAGSLTSEGNNTNVFEGTVTLWDEDRDPSDNEPLTGYALGIGGGTFTFKDDVEITASGKHAAFAGSTSTFEKHLNVGTGNVEIGHGGRAMEILQGYGQSYPNTPATVILNGASAAITATNVNIYENGTLQFDNTGTITGALNVVDGGTVKSASGKAVTVTEGIRVTNGTADFRGNVTLSNDELFINANSNVTFGGSLTVSNEGISIMNQSSSTAHQSYGNDTESATGATTKFTGAVTAAYLAIDQEPETGSSNNTFESTVTLNGYDSDVPGANTNLIVIDGTNIFKGAVNTSGKNAIFAKSTATFNAALNAGGGDVSIGYGPMLQELTDSRYNQTATVILNGNSAAITAANVNVYGKGVLDVRGNATVTGNLTFENGGAFTPNGNTLGVTGAVTVNEGAILNLSEIDSGKTILTSTTGITDTTGAFTKNILYDTSLSADAKSLTVNGIKGNDEIASGLAAAGVSAGANTAPGLGLILSSMSDLPDLEIAFQNFGKIVSSNPGRASIVLKQLLGLNSIQAIDATRTVAQSFSNRVFGRLSQIRDARTAMNNTPVQSGGALASIRGGDVYGSPANRIWAGGFGAFTRQSGEDGYRYDAGGFILGYDRQFGQNITAGFTGAYSRGREKDNSGFYRDDVDTMNLGLYASYDPQSGFYAEGNVGFGYSWNKEHEVNDPLIGGVKDGKFQTYSFQAGGNVGYAFMLPAAFRIIPTVGLQFIHLRQKEYQQTGTAAMWHGASSQNYIEIPLAVRVNKTFDLGNGMSITPEIRGAWICEAKKDEASIRMGYVGSDASATLFGTNPGRHRGLVGAGVKARFSRNVDAFVDYNLEFRSGYQNHNVMAGLGLSF